jgi:hypothetical protein
MVDMFILQSEKEETAAGGEVRGGGRHAGIGEVLQVKSKK